MCNNGGLCNNCLVNTAEGAGAQQGWYGRGCRSPTEPSGLRRGLFHGGGCGCEDRPPVGPPAPHVATRPPPLSPFQATCSLHTLRSTPPAPSRCPARQCSPSLVFRRPPDQSCKQLDRLSNSWPTRNRSTSSTKLPAKPTHGQPTLPHWPTQGTHAVAIANKRRAAQRKTWASTWPASPPRAPTCH